LRQKLIGLAMAFLTPGLLASTLSPHANARTETAMAANAVDPAVEKPLEQYDRQHDVDALRNAIDAAALHDGATVAEPEVARALSRARVFDWIAILSRFKRDVDPNFDFSKPPAVKVQPPGPLGLQYMPGVPPSHVKDLATRKAYEDAIAENDRKIALFGSMRTLMALHDTAVERAGASIRDAIQSLGAPEAEVRGMLLAGDIAPADRDALFKALGGA
jgi:hypothetical protein